MCSVANQFRIMQLGFTLFVADPRTPHYVAHSFNMYMFPAEVPGTGRTLVLDLDAVQFHKEHGFDFNKWIREGVEYVHAEEQATKPVETPQPSHKPSPSQNQNQSQRDNQRESDKQGQRQSLSQIKELQGLEASLSSAEDDFWGREEDAMELRHERSYGMRVQRVWELLTKLKVPLIGHNLYIDLVFLSSHFCGVLPSTLSEFKSRVRALFPV
jgi:poly(A)-specific ribonuclease